MVHNDNDSTQDKHHPQVPQQQQQQALLLSRPRIESLHEYQVSLNHEVRSYLEGLYAKHYHHVSGNSNTNHNNEGEARANEMAKVHVQRFLDRMKQPPRQTVLRVMTTTTTSVTLHEQRQRLMQQLEQILLEWIHKDNDYDDNDDNDNNNDNNKEEHLIPKVEPHALLNDVITVDLVPTIQTNTTDPPPPVSLYNCRVPHPSLYPRFFFSSCTTANDDNNNASTRAQTGWPLTHRVVMVDRMCGEAVLRGANIFVKGILAADPHVTRGETVAIYAHVGKESVTRGTLLQHYTGHCLFLGLGQTCGDRADLFAQATGVGVQMSRRSWERAGPILPPLNDLVLQHEAIQGGLFAQNLPSVVVGHVLDPQPGDVVYDMCGAPGGKTLHLAQLTNRKATIVMSDKSRSKVLAARSLFESMECGDCIYPLHIDATKCVQETEEGSGGHDSYDTNSVNIVQLMLSNAKPSEKDKLLEISAFPVESFDKILLDPPCSALGLRPKLCVAQSKSKDLVSFANYQKRFIRQAVRLLRPGGVLTFSTCTVHALENEGNVRFLLDEFPEMELVPIELELGDPGLAGYGLTDWERQCLCRFDCLGDQTEGVNFDVMGFFIAKFRKKTRD